MAYDIVIPDTLVTTQFVHMEAMNYNIAVRKLWHAKWNLHIMCGFIRASSRAVLKLVRPWFGIKMIYMFTLYHYIGGSTIPQEF